MVCKKVNFIGKIDFFTYYVNYMVLDTRSERCIPIKLLYPINYWDYHGCGWGLGQGSFYMHEMTIPISYWNC